MDNNLKELQQYCVRFGIKKSGNKLDVAKNILNFLKTNEKGFKKRKRNNANNNKKKKIKKSK